ncbi:HNH endonuclease [Alkalihalobacterium alkalinitrilicum]|uniref:HNH endonuclease n=1 Tax=Alkalihalobacterium alkalinitrilicum TaxID=427920 RepID=UPI001303D81E|nr:HNH endonuclease [Alkalihalobacterium alkalinitrilicum]
MKKKWIQGIGNTSGKVVGTVLGGSIKLAGKAVRNDYVQDIGESVYKASHFTCHTIGGLSQGVVDTAKGIVKKDKSEVHEGRSELGGTTWNATKTVGRGIKYTVKSSVDVATGVAKKDLKQTKEGLKNLGKVAVVGTVAFGVFDAVDGMSNTDTVLAAEPQPIETINSELAGTVHPISGVPFETNIVELPDGYFVEGVFPVFDSAFDAEIPSDQYESTDYTHAKIANEQIASALDTNPILEAQFNDIQLEQIRDGETPDGYTWHHHEEMGKIQLVETEPHDQSGHSGGRSLWGGGSDMR